MLISDEHLDDFINRWEKAYGESIDRGFARERATQLVELYKLIGRRAPPAGPSTPPATPE